LLQRLRLYFNLSGRQAGYPSVVRAFVEASRAGVALENLGVEITESDAMRDVAATRHVCRRFGNWESGLRSMISEPATLAFVAEATADRRGENRTAASSREFSTTRMTRHR